MNNLDRNSFRYNILKLNLYIHKTTIMTIAVEIVFNQIIIMRCILDGF